MAVTVPVSSPVARFRQAAVTAVGVVSDAAQRTVARGKRLSRIAQARAGYASGVLSSAWGVGVVFGFGWALIAGGVATSASFLLLYDVDERP